MRATLDKVISLIGLVMAFVLLVAAGLLIYASSFVGGQVGEQLSDQKITMPNEQAIAADEGLAEQDKVAMRAFAGSPMDTGAEAKAYADHFILAHLNHSTGGETYSTLGGKVREACVDKDSPACAEANALRDTAFKGSTLRGLLLNAYAFGTMGTIALWAGIGAALASLLLFVLALLGFRHAKVAAANNPTPAVNRV